MLLYYKSPRPYQSYPFPCQICCCRPHRWPNRTGPNSTWPDPTTRPHDLMTQPDWTRLDPTPPDRTPLDLTGPDPAQHDPTSMALWTCRRAKRVSEKQLFRIIHSLTLVGFALAILVVITLDKHGTRWTCRVQESKRECVRKSQHCPSRHYQHCCLARAQ